MKERRPISLLEDRGRKLGSIDMNFSSSQMVSSKRMSMYELNQQIGVYDPNQQMGMYDPNQQMGMWVESFKGPSCENTGASSILEAGARVDSRLEDVSHEAVGTSTKYDDEQSKPRDKVLRRLAQNREAAKKSRLKKKAYVQQLESGRIKLNKLEQELQRVRQQGIFIGSNGDSGDSSFGLSGVANSGIATFEMEYTHWVEEQNKQNGGLRTALQKHVSDVELRMLVENGLSHYDNLFRMKAAVAKSDVFYLMSGMWKTATERFFLWIGGFRPSELLKVLTPQIEPLTDQQMSAVCSLRQSCQQAEDALSQGMDKLQQTLAETLTSEPPISSSVPIYMGQMGQMTTAMGKLDALVSFVNQADHLRQQCLQQMNRILTTRQAARGLLALGDYLQRLWALSSIWSARPRQTT